MSNLIDPFYSLDWYGHERAIAASDCVASAFEITKSLVRDLNPACHEGRIDASLELGHFTLKAHFILRIE